MGVDFAFGDFLILPWMQIIYLVATTLIFYGLSLLIVSLKKQS